MTTKVQLQIGSDAVQSFFHTLGAYSGDLIGIAFSNRLPCVHAEPILSSIIGRGTVHIFKGRVINIK